MKTLIHYLTFAIFSAISFASSAQAPVIDGQNCSSGSIEWSETPVAIDANDGGGIPGTSDFNRMWAKSVGDTLYFAFTRALSNTGDASFAIHLNTDCDSTTGDLAHGGADKAMYLGITTSNKGVTSLAFNNVYEWTTSGGGQYSSTSTNYRAAFGDSTCSASNNNFFELAIGMDQLVDPCNMGSCGSIGLTNATAYSGLSLNSTLQDTLAINKSLFINDKPEIIMPAGPYEACSGSEIELDASGSTYNTNGTNDADSMVSIVWDMDYSGTFNVDRTGAIINETYIQASDSAVHHIGVVATDAFGCTDTAEFDITVYSNPIVTASYTVDDNFNQCQLYVWDYSITGSSDYAGNSLTDFAWDFPDGGTATGSSPSHVYSNCFWTILGDKTAYVTGTDNKGCYTTVSMEEPLPVDLVDFTVEKIEGNVELNWTTASEINNSHFEIERMEEGGAKYTIGKVQGAGFSNELNNYNHTDYNANNAVAYYRIKQIDFDGKYEYSDWVAVNQKAQTSFEMYPNPAHSSININIDSRALSHVELFSLDGKLVRSEQVTKTAVLNIDDLEPGFYVVRVSNDQGVHSTKLQVN